MPHFAPVTHLLYLHGFRSSPRSAKAVLLARYLQQRHPAVHWWCPQLPPSPRQAMDLIMDGIEQWPADRMGVIGSSLGGFYATHVAQRKGCRAVLLNPAVHPARDLASQIGEHPAWHDPNERLHFESRHVEELRALESAGLAHPGNFFLIAAKGDEVLDWREMMQRYPGARVKLLEGGDHGLSDFAQAHLADVLGFLGLAADPDQHPT